MDVGGRGRGRVGGLVRRATHERAPPRFLDSANKGGDDRRCAAVRVGATLQEVARDAGESGERSFLGADTTAAEHYVGKDAAQSIIRCEWRQGLRVDIQLERRRGRAGSDAAPTDCNGCNGCSAWATVCCWKWRSAESMGPRSSRCSMGEAMLRQMTPGRKPPAEALQSSLKLWIAAAWCRG